jgi:hypothetical protein
MSCITKEVQDYLDEAYDRWKEDLETEKIENDN